MLEIKQEALSLLLKTPNLFYFIVEDIHILGKDSAFVSVIEILLAILLPFAFLSSNTHLFKKILHFFHTAVKPQSKYSKKFPVLIIFTLS